jgi:hypothetical protein
MGTGLQRLPRNYQVLLRQHMQGNARKSRRLHQQPKRQTWCDFCSVHARLLTQAVCRLPNQAATPSRARMHAQDSLSGSDVLNTNMLLPPNSSEDALPLGTGVARNSSACDLCLDYRLMSDDLDDLDLADDMAWLHSDDPVASPGSRSSVHRLSCDANDDEHVDAAELLLSAGHSATLSLATESSHESGGHQEAFGGESLSFRSRQTPALRASKCSSSGVKATVQNQLSVGQVAGAEPAVLSAGPADGHVVRVMPVWMMPTVQHPQGRVVMMPVHFMPATTARNVGAAGKQVAASGTGGLQVQGRYGQSMVPSAAVVRFILRRIQCVVCWLVGMPLHGQMLVQVVCAGQATHCAHGREMHWATRSALHCRRLTCEIVKGQAQGASASASGKIVTAASPPRSRPRVS